MSEMVERVARALWGVSGHHFRCDWHGFIDEVRAAIAAMREPTEAMWEAGSMERGYVSPEAWSAMIDAALAEEKQPA